MRRLLFLFVGLHMVGTSLAGAEAQSDAVKAPENGVAASPPPPDQSVAVGDSAETPDVPAAGDVPATVVEENAAPSAPTEPVAAVVVPESVPATPAPGKDADVLVVPVVPSSLPPPAPPDGEAKAADLRSDLLAARVTLLEQQLLAQHDREVTLYRDTIRLVTIFGGAFAGLCIAGLLAASFLNYRALVAVQGAYGQGPAVASLGRAEGLLASPGSVPGIDRVQASGQRFQSRVSGLEQRLSELEHLAGRDPAVADDGGSVASSVAIELEPEIPVAPPRRQVPREMILVHKAQALTNLGKLGEALATLDEAAALDGDRTEVHLARGQVLEKLGRLGDALNAYEVAVGGDEQNTSALLLKAGLLNRQERFSEALACYERALEVHRASA